MVWQILALIWTAVMMGIAYFFPATSPDAFVWLWMAPIWAVLLWLMATRGPLRCTAPGCDRYSLSAGTDFRARRFWIRAKDLKKDHGIDVKALRFAPGRCHHHPEEK